MRVLILSSDSYLIRRIELELSEVAEIFKEYDGSVFDAIIFDCDTGKEIPQFPGQVIKISKAPASNDILPIPLNIGVLKNTILKLHRKPILTLSKEDKCAILGDKKIKLTSHEFSLLSLLISNGEKYTPRETISSVVWKDAKDGLINIYIHYLREKLETGGEKIIISSRKYGYKINERYML